MPRGSLCHVTMLLDKHIGHLMVLKGFLQHFLNCSQCKLKTSFSKADVFGGGEWPSQDGLGLQGGG